MIKHFLKSAWRNILNRKLLSIVQILGFSLGIATFILVTRYAHYEKNWDKFNTNFDRIFRVQHYLKKDRSNVGTQTVPALSSYINENIPEVEQSITIREVWGEILSSSPELTFYEEYGYLATSEVFNVFSFELIEGNPSNVLNGENSIVLSEKTASKFFPNQNAVGKTMYDQQKNPLTVTGVMKNIPANSHIKADYFKSFASHLLKNKDNWYNNAYRTYALLKNENQLATVDDKVKGIYDEFHQNNKNYLYLQPLKNLHLRADDTGDMASVVFFYSLIGMLILLLACTNFMSISTSLFSIRSSEIGIRKVNGSHKKLVMVQFLGEAVVISMLSLMIAVLLSYLVLPFFNSIVSREISLGLFRNPQLFLFIVSISLGVGLLSAIYPALVASRFNPSIILKGANPFSDKKQGISGQKIMVFSQFILSAIMISSGIWSYKQVSYLKNKDLGFDKQHTLYCKISETETSISYETLRNQILENPAIENMCISFNTPLHNNWGSQALYEGGAADDLVFVRWNRAGYNFLETYKFQILQGRNFSREFSTDNEKCIINKKAVKRFGWDDPIGRWIKMDGNRYQVVGVVEDFHQDDVHHPIKPYVLFLHNSDLNRGNDFGFLINPESRAEAVAHIKKVMETNFPNILFNVYTFDDSRETTDLEIWSNVRDTFGFFTVLSIIIACIGIFGLVLFTTQRKIKEIGIRKTSGAKTSQIFVMITNKYNVLILLANAAVISVPYILSKTTPGAFKYHFTIFDYFLVFGITYFMVFISSTIQAIRAANRNPVEALRYE